MAALDEFERSNVSKPSEEDQRIADMLSDVVEEAIRLQDTAKQSVVDLQKEIERLRFSTSESTRRIESIAQALPGYVESAIDKQLTAAAKQAADTMVSQWDRANKAAERAARMYEVSFTKFLPLLVFVFVFGLLLGVALTVWLLHGN